MFSRLAQAFNVAQVVSKNDRLRDSVAARICEQRKRAFRCITNDLGQTHGFRTTRNLFADGACQPVLTGMLL